MKRIISAVAVGLLCGLLISALVSCEPNSGTVGDTTLNGTTIITTDIPTTTVPSTTMNDTTIPEITTIP